MDRTKQRYTEQAVHEEGRGDQPEHAEDGGRTACYYH